MSYGYVAYVDEAGDDGIGQFRTAGLGGQSHWLVLSACIVAAENERSVVGWRDEIARAFPKRKSRGLHFRDLNHEQRVFAATKIAGWPVGILSVLSYKPSIVGRPFEQTCRTEKNILYKYLMRYLIEKITQTVERRHGRIPSGNGKVKIVFSRRGGLDYESFRTYLTHLAQLQSSRGSYHPIVWKCLDAESIAVEDHSRLAGLQLADAAASSFFQAVEINLYGMTEPRYALALKERVVKSKTGKQLYFGVKPVPGIGQMTLTPEQHAFFRHWA